jgi:AcrR family transcriptional regulator
MPKMAPEARHERRRQLVEAGWRCVGAKGYRNLTVDDICTEAGLSKGSFYTYFEGKRDLLVALIDEDGERIGSLMSELAADRLHPLARIERLLKALMQDGVDSGRAQLRADLWAEVASDDEVRNGLAAGLRQRRSLLAAWIRDAQQDGEMVDIPANAFASMLLALAEGLMVHSAVDPGSFRWDNVAQAVSVILATLGPRPARTPG